MTDWERVGIDELVGVAFDEAGVVALAMKVEFRSMAQRSDWVEEIAGGAPSLPLWMTVVVTV